MKRKKDILYNFWSGAILLCVVLVFFSLIFVSCAKPAESDATTPPVSASGLPDADTTPDATMTPTGTEDPAAPSDNPTEPTDPVTPTDNGSASVILGETEDMGREYLDKFVFLGDSTTYGLGVYYNLGYTDLVPPSQVWTPANGTLTLNQWSFTAIVYPDTGTEMLIPEAVEAKKPEYMLITLGVNGVSFMDEEYFKSEYTNLVNAVKEKSPDTKIILNSIYPVAASYQYLGDINNEKISAANGWIQQIAADTGVKYLDSASVLIGEDGWLPESAHNSDGMHLTGESFGKVLEYVRTHGYQ
jgi:lysophospholipase L1-like esterase